MKDKIEEKLNELYEDLDMWLEINDDPFHKLYYVSEERIKTIRAKIMVLKEILED